MDNSPNEFLYHWRKRRRRRQNVDNTDNIFQRRETDFSTTATSLLVVNSSTKSCNTTFLCCFAILYSLILFTNLILLPVAAAGAGFHGKRVKRQRDSGTSSQQQQAASTPPALMLPSRITIGMVMPTHHYHGAATFSSNAAEKNSQQNFHRASQQNFSNSNLTKNLRAALQAANAELIANAVHTELQIRLIEVAANPVTTSFSVCERLLSGAADVGGGAGDAGTAAAAAMPIYAVIVGSDFAASAAASSTTSSDFDGESAQLATASVSYTSGFLQIPVLSLTRDSEFSDKNAHRLVLRILPAYSHQADVWVQILKYFALTANCQSAAAAAAAWSSVSSGGTNAAAAGATPLGSRLAPVHHADAATPAAAARAMEFLDAPSAPVPSIITRKNSKTGDAPPSAPQSILRHPGLSSSSSSSNSPSSSNNVPLSRHYRSLSTVAPPPSATATRTPPALANIENELPSITAAYRQLSSSLERLRSYSRAPSSSSGTDSHSGLRPPYSYYYVDNDDEFYQTITTPFLDSSSSSADHQYHHHHDDFDDDEPIAPTRQPASIQRGHAPPTRQRRAVTTAPPASTASKNNYNNFDDIDLFAQTTPSHHRATGVGVVGAGDDNVDEYDDQDDRDASVFQRRRTFNTNNNNNNNDNVNSDSDYYTEACADPEIFAAAAIFDTNNDNNNNNDRARGNSGTMSNSGGGGGMTAAATMATNAKTRPGWTNVVVITSSDADGRFLLSRLHSAGERNDIKIEDSIVYESGTSSIREQLFRVIASATSRVFLVHAPTLNDSSVIFRDAEALGLTGAHSVWLVSEQALASPHCPAGALGIRLAQRNSNNNNNNNNVGESSAVDGGQVRDAVRIVARALVDIVRSPAAPAAQNVFGAKSRPPPTSCVSSSSTSTSSSPLTVPTVFDINAPAATSPRLLLSGEHRDDQMLKSSSLLQHDDLPLFQPAASLNNPSSYNLMMNMNNNNNNNKDQSSKAAGGGSGGDTAMRWAPGPLFFSYLLNQTLRNGDTGFIKFDDTGDRLYANYEIVNVAASINNNNNNNAALARRNIIGSFHYQHNRHDGDGDTAVADVVGDMGGGGGPVYGRRKSYERGKMRLRMNINDIVWPGGMRRQLPRGYVMPSHLIATTIVETPFVYAERVGSQEECETHVLRNSSSGWSYATVYCQRGHGWTPADGDVIGEHNCCYGYCIDLLLELSTALNFTFDLLLSPQAGASIQENITYRETAWTGIVGDLVTRRADISVAPITITPERVRVIDFSKPFKYQGITIMIKKAETVSKLNSFLQPFHYELWLLVGVALHVVALVLYLLDRFSPFGRYRLSGHYHHRHHQQLQQQQEKSKEIVKHTGSNATTITAAATAAAAAAAAAECTEVIEEYEEDSLNLSSAMWFAWGVLLNSGIGEGTPRSFGGRVLGMVWAGFAMIMVASYTANLAAFLVLDRSQTRLAGINDPHLRNPTENITFATVKDSAVHMYFKRQVELSAMLRKMEKWNFNNADDAIRAVKTDELKAFIYDSSRLEYEAARDCDLITVGELFGRSGYGVALPKGSPWTEQVSLHILGMHERGEMERLDKRWIQTAFGQLEQCNLAEDAPATLGLSNMMGVFILIAVGIFAGLMLIFVEISYKRHNRRRQREIELARRTIERWRKFVERKKKARSALYVSAQVIRARGVFIRHSLGARDSTGSTGSSVGGNAAAHANNAARRRPPLTSASTGNLIALKSTVNNAMAAAAAQQHTTENNTDNSSNTANTTESTGAMLTGDHHQPPPTMTPRRERASLTKGWTVDVV